MPSRSLFRLPVDRPGIQPRQQHLAEAVTTTRERIHPGGRAINGKLYVVGGYGNANAYLTNTQVYTP